MELKHYVLIAILVAVVLGIMFVFWPEITSGTKLGYLGNDPNVKLRVYNPGDENDKDKIYELQPSKNGYANQGYMIFMNLDTEPNKVIIEPWPKGNRVFVILSAEGYINDKGMTQVRCPIGQNGSCFWLTGKVTLVNPDQMLVIAR